jgi:hypothetical protein
MRMVLGRQTVGDVLHNVVKRRLAGCGKHQNPSHNRAITPTKGKS